MRYKDETLEVGLGDCRPGTHDQQPTKDDLKAIPFAFYQKAHTVRYLTREGGLILLKSRHSKS